MRLKERWARRRPPRLAWVLIALNALLLVLPLLGISALRLYESALIRQTETELTAQGAVIAAAARVLLALPPPTEADAVAWQPHTPQLDLATSPVRPPLPEPRSTAITMQPGGAEPAFAATGAPLTAVLKESQRHTLAALRVTDARGAVIAATNPQWVGASIADHAEVQEALTGGFAAALHARAAAEGRIETSIGRTRDLRVVVAVPIISGTAAVGAVELLRTPADIGQALWAKRHALAMALLVLLAIAAFVTWLSLRLILRPLAALRDSTQAAADGAPYRPPPHRGLAEFAALDRSVAQMAETLQQRTAYIRDFAAHISHEFKTPLASILASTELLHDHADMAPLQRQRFIGLIAAEATRLDRLTQSLLELARAETATPSGVCDVAERLRSILHRYREQDLNVAWNESTPSLPVAMPADLLETCLSTVLDNARVHGGNGVAVSLAVRCEGDTVIVEIADDGPGLSDANATRLFTPFFTTARESGHTGLGLSIARALLRAHGGDLLLTQTRPARFALRLPAANPAVDRDVNPLR